jgi:glycerate 2-kinase
MTAAESARDIFHHAVASCSIPAAFDRRVRFAEMSLDRYQRIYAVAVGKAALPMLDTLIARLPRPLSAGICCAPVLPAERRPEIHYYAGGHPLPNLDSFASAHAALELLRATGPGDFVFFLISGGGSAMFELPYDPRISFADTQVLYQALVGSGSAQTLLRGEGGTPGSRRSPGGEIYFAGFRRGPALPRRPGFRSYLA